MFPWVSYHVFFEPTEVQTGWVKPHVWTKIAEHVPLRFVMRIKNDNMMDRCGRDSFQTLWSVK